MLKMQAAPIPADVEDTPQVSSADSTSLSDIPPSETWLYENTEALAAVRRGLDDAANGRVVSLGSFASYADLEIDD